MRKESCGARFAVKKERGLSMGERMQIDCRGLKCPQPVLKAKEALEQMESGEIEITVDNEGSASNLERFAASRGCPVTVQPDGADFRIVIAKTAGSRPAAGAPAADSFTCAPETGGLVYAVASATMGRGDEELGRILLRAWIKTIREVAPLPARIFFYNSGVTITAVESDLIQPLRDLEAKGVEIFSCGTCLDFFHLQEGPLVGKKTNMYEIMQSMAKAAKVVSPL
jgi:selenium metabolism protein YedF